VTSVRSLLVVLALLLPLGLVASPASAAGKNCASTGLARWCAEMTGDNDSVTGLVEIIPRRDRVRVRVAGATLQRRTADGGWVAVDTLRAEVYWARGQYVVAVDIPCSEAARRSYRVTGTVKWKLGAGGEVRSRRITSDPVRKSRLCD